MKAARLSRATVRLVVLAAVPALLTGLTACTSDDDGGTADTSTSAAETAATSPAAPAVSGPFGSGCDIFTGEGPSSIPGFAGVPVATAISAVPQLSTLTQAVISANLVDVLNTRPDVTVLAPSNAAFDALGADALPALLADVPRLTTVLTHHVLAGRLTPEQLVGEHMTLNGDSITVTAPAAAPTLSPDQTLAGVPATVLCGNVPTVNAIVYVIDQVLTPAQ